MESLRDFESSRSQSASKISYFRKLSILEFIETYLNVFTRRMRTKMIIYIFVLLLFALLGV